MTRVSVVIFVSALALAVVVIARKKEKDSARLPVPAFSVIAKAGQWITNPGGIHVCRLTSDLWSGMIMRADLCGDWIGPKPVIGQKVSWLRCRFNGGCQINIEGEWRP